MTTILKPALRALAAVLAAAVVLTAGTPAPGDLEPYLEIELKRLEETYHLLDSLAGKVWPGWDNYGEIQFKIQFPSLVHMLVNPQGEVPEGYEVLPGRTIHGRPVYLDRREQLPVVPEPPLSGGGQGDTEIRIRLSETGLAKRLATLPEEAVLSMKRSAASENQILLYIHEFFHTFQQHAWTGWDKNKGDRAFASTAEYAAYSEIEGRALAAAYATADDREALERLRDYLVARETKHGYMTPGGIQREVYVNLEEGLAVYGETRLAQLIKETSLAPKLTAAGDPYFLGYAYLDDYIQQKTLGTIDFVTKMTLDTGMKYYTYGALEAFLLDRFVPGWKTGFFETQTDLDEPLRRFLKLSDQDRAAATARLEKRYGLSEALARHGAVIKERDDAFALATGLKGRKFVLDWQNTKEFFILSSRGKSVRVGVRVVYREGFEPFKLGEISLTSERSVFYAPGIWNLEWVDTAPKAGRGFEVTCESRDGDVYRNAVVTTGGFTLKAPEIKIEESDQEVRIVILSKVAR